MTRLMTPVEYIAAWNANVKQHFDDGDYEWICDRIRQIPSEKPINKILEIGCGSGYSTLLFLLSDFDVVSIDANVVAIDAAKQLIEEHDYDPRSDVKLLNLDVVHDYKAVKEESRKNSCDIILFCNPGGTNLFDKARRELA